MDCNTTFDNLSILSELTEQTDGIENYDLKIDEIKNKLNKELNNLNNDTLKDKCKELGLNGISKLKKSELIQLLENEFSQLHLTIREKTKNELKNLCKIFDGKKLSTSKKEYLVFQILTYYSNNLLFRLINDDVETMNIKEPVTITVIEELEKQKQEIEIKMQEELKKKEEETKRIIDEEERKKIDEEKKEAKRKKQSIPKNVRIIVWNHYIGEDIIKHKCLCCKKVTISNTNFEVGHVLSEKNGGTHEINNLRPVCFACNHSMGYENMIDFVVKFGLYIG